MVLGLVLGVRRGVVGVEKEGKRGRGKEEGVSYRVASLERTSAWLSSVVCRVTSLSTSLSTSRTVLIPRLVISL